MNKFIEHAKATLGQVADTMSERGSQYADTWGEDACWHLTKSILKKYGYTASDDLCKVLGLSTFIDQKYSRFAGSYKEDTAVDLVSYIAALTDAVKELDTHTK